MSGKDSAAAEILTKSGFGNLGQPPSEDDVYAVLESFGQYLAGVGPLLRQVCVASAVSSLRMTGFCNQSIAERLVRAALTEAEQDTSEQAEEAWLTYGPTPDGAVIVDLVRRGKNLAWVVAYPPGSRTHPMSTVAYDLVDEVPGRHMWPAAALPWTGIPSADAVREAWDAQDRGWDDARTLSHDLINVFHEHGRYVILDDARWAVLLAAWVMGSYLLDRFDYYPVILLEGPPARGKTRLGKALAFLARRGMDTPSPTTATIFRNRSRHRISLFLDVMDLPGRMERSDEIADMLLTGFEREKKVWRVLSMDAKTPPQEMKGFTVYGATVLASNKHVRDDHPLVSRSLRVPLPEAGGRRVRAAVRADDMNVLKLRARLVAWAARVIGEGFELPRVDEGALTGRLRDIALPLLQVVQLVRPPEYGRAMAEFLREQQETAKGHLAETWEGSVVAALEALRRDGRWGPAIGTLSNTTVIERLNEHLPEREHYTPKRLGKACQSLGLRTVRSKDKRYRYVVFPGDENWAELCVRYGGGAS